MVTEKEYDLALKLMEELRKEIVSSQSIRTQIVGFKITFVTASLGLILANMGKVPIILFFIPAFAAIFFDFLINGYNFSIRLMGFYIRTFIEPILKEHSGWPMEKKFWEEYLATPENRQIFSTIGELGLTSVAFVPAFVTGIIYPTLISIFLLVILVCFFVYDVHVFFIPRKITEGQPQIHIQKVLKIIKRQWK